MDDQKEIIERAGDSSILKEGMDVSASNRPFHLKPGIIYKVTNLVNGKIYIGKTVFSLKARRTRHISDSKINSCKFAFHKALLKYGKDCFIWEVLESVIFHDLLFDLEKFYIKKFNCKIPNGYNMTDGGEGVAGYKCSAEHIRKTRRTGSHHSVETRRKMSESHKGNKCALGYRHTLEDIKKMSASAMGNKYSLGYHHSEETKRKRSKAFSGKKHWNFGKHRPDNVKEKIRNGVKKYYSSEHPRKLSESIFMK